MWHSGLWFSWWSLFSAHTLIRSCKTKWTTWLTDKAQYYAEYAQEKIHDPKDPSYWDERWGFWHPTVSEWKNCYLYKLKWDFSARRPWHMHVDDSRKTWSNTSKLLRDDAPQFNWQLNDLEFGIPNYDSMRALGDELYYGELWEPRGFPFGVMPVLYRNWLKYFYDPIFTPGERLVTLSLEFCFFIIIVLFIIGCLFFLANSLRPIILYFVISSEWLSRSIIFTKLKMFCLWMDRAVFGKLIPGGRFLQISVSFLQFIFTSWHFDWGYKRFLFLLFPVLLLPIWLCFFLLKSINFISFITFTNLGETINSILNYFASWFGPYWVLLGLSSMFSFVLLALTCIRWDALPGLTILWRIFFFYIFCAWIYLPWFETLWALHDDSFTFSSLNFYDSVLIYKKLTLHDYIQVLENYCISNNLVLSPEQQVWLLKLAKHGLFMEQDPALYCSTFHKIYITLEQDSNYFISSEPGVWDHFKLRWERSFPYHFYDWVSWLQVTTRDICWRGIYHMAEHPLRYAPLAGGVIGTSTFIGWGLVAKLIYGYTGVWLFI